MRPVESVYSLSPKLGSVKSSKRRPVDGGNGRSELFSYAFTAGGKDADKIDSVSHLLLFSNKKIEERRGRPPCKLVVYPSFPLLLIYRTSWEDRCSCSPTGRRTTSILCCFHAFLTSKPHNRPLRPLSLNRGCVKS